MSMAYGISLNLNRCKLIPSWVSNVYKYFRNNIKGKRNMLSYYISICYISLQVMSIWGIKKIVRKIIMTKSKNYKLKYTTLSDSDKTKEYETEIYGTTAHNAVLNFYDNLEEYCKDEIFESLESISFKNNHGQDCVVAYPLRNDDDGMLASVENVDMS